MTTAATPSGSPVKEEMRAWRVAFLSIGVFSGIINVLALAGSMYMLQVYDRVIPSKSVPTLIGLSVLLVVLYTAFGALDHVRIRVLSRIGVGIDRQLRPKVLQAVLLLPLRSRQGTDGLQPVRDLDQVRAFLSSLGPTAFFDMPWLPIYLILIYLLHPMLGLFATAGAIVLVTLTAITEYRTRAPARASIGSGIARSTFGSAAHRNAEVIRAMGLQYRIGERWHALNERHLGDQLSMSDAATSIGALSKVMRLLLQSGILGLGAYLAIHGEISSGAIIAASIVMSRALSPIEIAIAHWKGFTQMRDSSKRLDALLAALPKDAEFVELPAPATSLTVQNLTVAPPGQSLPTLTDISFRLDAGDGLGVIGPSASGKSTLVRTIVGAWLPMPRGGSVRLDDATHDQWRPEELGRHIGYLPQDIELFEGTVAENIARLDANGSSEDIIAAARLAGIHEMIVNLAEGYQTRIGEGGMRLSAGQRQLVGLARALYGDPLLVVLDEPNSNLDAAGDAALTRAIAAVRARSGIVVVVAHRRSALFAVNKILALVGGRVHAFGPRDEVLQKVLRSAANTEPPTEPSGLKVVGAATAEIA